MGIALLSLADFFVPLQSLADRWMPTRQSLQNSVKRKRLSGPSISLRSGLRYVGVRPKLSIRTGAAPQAPSTQRSAVARPLRVIQTIETPSANLSTRGNGASRQRQQGRLLISGRMADVCAELDRLAALEKASQTSHTASL